MKKIMSVTIEEELISWLAAYSQSQSKFRNKSHLVEVALEKLKEQEEEENKTQRSTKNRQATQSTRKRATTHAPTTSTTHRRNLLLKSKE